MTPSIVWLVFALVILLISGLVGLHLGRFREAYTEMTGMMAGMTMGMLNGFLLGFAPYFTRAVALEAGETAARHTQAAPKRLVDYYAFLGVPPDATEGEVRAAYQARLRAGGEAGAEAERARRALSILTDPARRAAYDARLQATRTAGPPAPTTSARQHAPTSRNGHAEKRGRSQAAGARQPARGRSGGTGPLV